MGGKYRLRAFLYSLVLSAAAAGGSYAYLHFNTPPVRDAEAVIYFTDIDNNVDIFGKVDEVNRKFSDIPMLEEVSITSKVPLWKISTAVSAEKIENSCAIRISLTDLENVTDAPIILGTLLNFMGRDMENMNIVTYCDMNYPPVFPKEKVSLCGGGMIGALFYSLVSAVKGRRKKGEEPEKEQPIPQPKESAPKKERSKDNTSAYAEEAVRKCFSLGKVEYALPAGIAESNYASAAKLLMTAAVGNTAPVIAVTAANEQAYEGIAPSYAKFCAYIACAAAMEKKRVAVIECNLHKPHVSSLFGNYATGGIADIVSGKCTVWNAFVYDVRPGVDIISEEYPHPAPMAVFSAPAFSQFITYISGQYDLVLLSTARAWNCDEWKYILDCCSGFVAVTENESLPDEICGRGINETEGKKKFICSVTRPDKEWIL